MGIGGIALICITVIILVNLYFDYNTCPLGHKCVCKSNDED